jgi:hypothetical protein
VEPYPVDLEAEQLVHWLLDEEHRHTHDLLVRTTRSYERSALKAAEDQGLDDAEREDLSEITEVGLLEVTPRRYPSLWTLRIRVADDIGPRLPEDPPASATEEEIDLSTFYDEFIKKDRGLAEVSAEAGSPAAKASLTKLIEAILADRHRRAKGR